MRDQIYLHCILAFDLHSDRIQVGAIGPHFDAILICFELPPPLPPRWFPSLASPCWLCSSSLCADDLTSLKSRNLPVQRLSVEVCAGDPFVSHVQASGVFFHWVCRPYCVVQFWLRPLHLLLCPSRKCPKVNRRLLFQNEVVYQSFSWQWPFRSPCSVLCLTVYVNCQGTNEGVGTLLESSLCRFPLSFDEPVSLLIALSKAGRDSALQVDKSDHFPCPSCCHRNCFWFCCIVTGKKLFPFYPLVL